MADEMNEENLSSDDLWLKIINEGVEDRVEVNQRMLIDKMLARYSSDFVVYRELIQNSDDAHATSFILQIKCNSKEIQQNATENDFHNCEITEIRTINNGNTFTEDDWKRVITIAEGNTNIDAIGQFGVGFFSVFSYSEKPMIQSGKHYLAFVWQNGKSLTTFRKELPFHERLTSVILPMKNKYILQAIPDDNQTTPYLNLTRLKAFLTKVLSFTKYINEVIIQINSLHIFQVNKTKKPLSSMKLTETSNLHSFLRFKSLTQTEQTFKILRGPSITLIHIDVESKVKLDEDFHQHIENVLKKRLPSLIHIELLFPSNRIFESEQWNDQVFRDLIPLRHSQGKYSPSGQIFIGLGTHQSTGVGMHIYSHLVPTIERENIDLQDPYISKWNEQLLKSIGHILRLVYDQTMLEIVNHHPQHLYTILSLYAFQTSAPNKAIGEFLLGGFLASDRDLLVPIRRCPSDTQFSLISSRQAYVSNSKYMENFLTMPLIPYAISQADFIQILKHHGRVQELSTEIVVEKIRESIFVFDELIELLHWLCTNDIEDKSYIKQIFSEIYYRETLESSIIELKNVQFYSAFHLPSFIPLPTNILPSNVGNHISHDDLQRKLSLSKVPMRNLIHFYLLGNQHYLFENEITSKILLNFLYQYWTQFHNDELNQIKAVLSKLKCISTNQGMKLPQESFIPSANLSAHLPTVSQIFPDDNSQSVEFLRSIGCRTFHASFMESMDPTNNDQSLQHFVQDLLKQRETMSDGDINALRNIPCLTGTTLQSNGKLKRKCKGNQLHFPSVAKDLHWQELLIIDWVDINPFSQECMLLKELGVREAPDLPTLLSRIVQEHEQKSKIESDYELPVALIYFAENFRKYYLESWKSNQVKTPFLPSSPPKIEQSSEVILTTPQSVFKELNPLCPSLLPKVMRCFSHCFDISLLGIKSRPDLQTAFDVLMDKRDRILTVESAPIYFSYLNKLEGLNRTFTEKAASKFFIPLSNSYSKPSQVFIRSSNIPLDDDDKAAAGLIDYIDYGPEANSFLFSIGVVSFPSVETLADLLIERQSSYFARPNEMLKAKLRVYINCLKQLAAIPNIKERFRDEPLKSRLIDQPWCLGYQTIKHSDGTNENIFRVTKPSEIYLDDDHQSAIDLRPLCAPDESDLVRLYEAFGAKWLSESIERTLMHTGKVSTTQRSKMLCELIDHRLDMLFVNKRGEYLENIDEKRLDLLRKHLSVYESEGIQCKITFERRTIVLDSTDCSSCVLEHDKSQVNLYIHRDLPTLDYIDIASELIRFVHKKPLETLVHSISDKLSSPLETLKRRGIPVDRLLKQRPTKLVVRNEPIKPQSNIQNQSWKFDPYYQETFEKASNEFVQSLKDFFSPTIEKHSSNIERTGISDFGESPIDVDQLTQPGRSYSENEFQHPEYSKYENNNLCEYVPPSNMIRHPILFHNIALYIDKNVHVTDLMIKQGEQFAYILSSLAQQVFHMSVSVVHLFRDINSARIAFNNNGALFFNLRYFEQVFASDLAKNHSVIRPIMNFYFLIFCHELTHNIHVNHDLNFLHYFQRVIVKFMDDKENFLSTFSFLSKQS
ncbi:unnamed protein product [Adineta ricciae]|nr:unnamed protein product [Adineta ricciae]